MANVYVWYSAATDVTGKKLSEALNATGGIKKPASNKKVICWGTKTKNKVVLPNKEVFNHPNNIMTNRHKFKALDKMDKAGVAVAMYTTNIANVGTADMPYPVVARTNYHQGGAGFWICLNKNQLNQAVKEGAQYFQTYINIKDEYRLHVVDGKVVYAVKKVPRDNLKEAFVHHYKDHVLNFANKKNIDVDEATIDFVLKRLARKMATSVDMITRSNTRGWKFSRININNLKNNLKDEATACVKALGLDYGAVDCCIDTDGKAWIIECNTGPGLEGSSFEAWVKAFKTLINTDKKKAVAKKNNDLDAVKNELKEKAKAIAKMLELAENENEVEVIQKLWAKM
jgi:glutathione synthase/RimK-type ligase-like ATP-grasp enzyme